MQDILAATVEDFNPELVLNLDNDKDTNFAVFNENTLVAKEGEASNIVTSGDGTYTIKNADARFLAMQPGDTFANTGNMKYRKRATNTYYWVAVSYCQSPKIVMKL